MTTYQIDPKRLVGLEGMFGLVWIHVVIFMVSFIECPSTLLCDIGGQMEDPINGYRQLFADPWVIGFTMIILVMIVFINLNVMILTKTVSCVFSSFMNATRCITVWIVSVCIGMESVQWESGI
jgi:hypothetical protein